MLLQSSKPEMDTATAQEQDEHVGGFEPPSRAILLQSSKSDMETTTAQEQDEHAGGFEPPITRSIATKQHNRNEYDYCLRAG